jgi:hypothetical protein
VKRLLAVTGHLTGFCQTKSTRLQKAEPSDPRLQMNLV